MKGGDGEISYRRGEPVATKPRQPDHPGGGVVAWNERARDRRTIEATGVDTDPSDRLPGCGRDRDCYAAVDSSLPRRRWQGGRLARISGMALGVVASTTRSARDHGTWAMATPIGQRHGALRKRPRSESHDHPSRHPDNRSAPDPRRSE